MHTTLLKRFRSQDDLQNIEEDEKQIWEVEEIVNGGRVKRVVHYPVLCIGCTELEDTQETFDHLYNFPEKLQKFWQKFPKKLPDERYV